MITNIIFILFDVLWLLMNMNSWFNTREKIWADFYGYHILTLIISGIILLVKVL